MTQIRIKLTADHFRTLVTGGEVNFDQSDIVRSKGIELKSTTDDGVSIRIKLTADHFRTLVTGGEVNFDQSDIVRSKGIGT